MRFTTKYLNQRKQELITLRMKRKTLTQIVEITGISKSALERYYSNIGMTRKRFPELFRRKKWDRQEYIKLARQGYSNEELAKHFGISYNAASVRLTTLRDNGFNVPSSKERKNIKLKNQNNES